MTHNTRIILSTIFILLGYIVLGAGGLKAAPQDPMAGQIIAENGQNRFELPMLALDYDIRIEGDVATVELTQSFLNPSQVPVNATYLFPLNQSAAVYGMTMKTGDEVVEAVIQKKAEAKANFEAAKSQGKSASLLEQHRPNMFTQNIANLMPGDIIEIRLRYTQTVPKVDGARELVVPLVVGPRYVPPKPERPALVANHPTDDLTVPAKSTEKDGWVISNVPEYPEVSGLTIPPVVDDARVKMQIQIQAPVTIGNLTSATHAIDIAQQGDAYVVTLSDGRTVDNRDFVLRYALGGDATEAGLLSHYDDKNGGVVSVMIEPPALPEASQITARELVFVLDTSGSMGGMPLNASKHFMNEALKNLRPTDYVRIITFDTATSQMSKRPIPADPDGIAYATDYVNALTAGGGTDIDNAIHAAFDTPALPDVMRIVVFLSDGYIGNEADVFSTIRNRIGDARIYAFGVGSAVNRFLLDGIANEGRGYARYIDPTEDSHEVAQKLAQDLKSPLLTDIQIDWGDLQIADQVPQRVPDLFAGGAVRAYARYQKGGAYTVTITGKVQGRPARYELPVVLPSSPQHADALPLIWARTKIKDLMRDYATAKDPEPFKDAVTKLGLDYNLQTEFTSFVAISKRVVNAQKKALDHQVPLHQVAGVTASAYGYAPTPSGFAGSSTPEPESIIGILLGLAFVGFRMRRRRMPATA